MTSIYVLESDFDNHRCLTEWTQVLAVSISVNELKDCTVTEKGQTLNELLVQISNLDELDNFKSHFVKEIVEDTILFRFEVDEDEGVSILRFDFEEGEEVSLMRCGGSASECNFLIIKKNSFEFYHEMADYMRGCREYSKDIRDRITKQRYTHKLTGGKNLELVEYDRYYYTNDGDVTDQMDFTFISITEM